MNNVLLNSHHLTSNREIPFWHAAARSPLDYKETLFSLIYRSKIEDKYCNIKEISNNISISKLHTLCKSQSTLCKPQSTLWKLTKIGTDDCYNKFKKSTKVQSNAYILDGDMTSNIDVISHALWRHNSVNRDIHRAYLLVKFHDDRKSRTCWTKSPSF